MFGTHPDTIALTIAKAEAARSGHAQGSRDYKVAFRKAYENATKGEESESLTRYLSKLDEEIDRGA